MPFTPAPRAQAAMRSIPMVAASRLIYQRAAPLRLGLALRPRVQTAPHLDLRMRAVRSAQLSAIRVPADNSAWRWDTPRPRIPTARRWAIRLLLANTPPRSGDLRWRAETTARRWAIQLPMAITVRRLAIQPPMAPSARR